jgi:hypothetical protein
MAKHDYHLGDLAEYGKWPTLRTQLGCLYNGCLTPLILSAGDDGWRVSVRATRRLTHDEITYLNGWYDGAIGRTIDRRS